MVFDVDQERPVDRRMKRYVQIDMSVDCDGKRRYGRSSSTGSSTWWTVS